MKVLDKFLEKIIPSRRFVFIVEDNVLYAKSLQGFLITRFPDLHIKVFPDGETFLSELKFNPHVVIMDYLLNTNHSNAATGLSIIEKIKKSNPETNIILLSAKTELEVFVKAISEYGCTYLRKDEQPFHKVEQFIKANF